MAGNIIHAIASTNATIAGMIVVEALKILAGLPEVCKVGLLSIAFTQSSASYSMTHTPSQASHDYWKAAIHLQTCMQQCEPLKLCQDYLPAVHAVSQ